MISSFFIKSSALKIFTWIFLIPFLIGCVFIRFNQPMGVIVWPVISATGALFWMTIIGLHLLQRSPIGGGLNKNVFKICVSILFSLPVLLATQPFFGLEVAEIILKPLVSFVLTICSLYCLYCISKSLTTLEFKRSSGFSTYAGTLIILSMLPLGIFLVQPRVQRLSNPQTT